VGRHTGSSDLESASPGLGPVGRIGLVAAGLVTVVGIGVLVTPDEAFARLPWGGQACSAEPVDVVVAPEAESLVRELLAPEGENGGLSCVQARVRAQEPDETAASAQILPVDRAPQVWIPDATSWTLGEGIWPTTSHGSLGTSPVVIATSSATAEKMGWDEKNPSWRGAMRGDVPVAVPDYRAQAESLDALIALWQTIGRGKRADRALVAPLLAADRSEIPSPDVAMATARSGSSNAPLIPTTEQDVARQNRSTTNPNLVAVYPREGSPRLDFPVLTVDGAVRSEERKAAVKAVTERLTSPDVQDAVRRAGFRNSHGDRPEGNGIRADYTLELKRPDRATVDAILARMDRLSKPSRILTLIDVSTSMEAKLEDGVTKISLATAAVRLGARTLPDSAQLGGWIFSSKLDGNRDYRELAPVRRLGSRTSGGQDWRSHVQEVGATLPRRLAPGGTGLYDVTAAAFDHMHDTYDPRTSNAIILLSDGGNEDPGSISLKALLAQLEKRNQGDEKVAIFAVGMGPDADYDALEKIGRASGGWWYRLDNAPDAQKALSDGLRRNRQLGQQQS
jgi:Ca-activated chloride channel family protein